MWPTALPCDWALLHPLSPGCQPGGQLLRTEMHFLAWPEVMLIQRCHQGCLVKPDACDPCHWVPRAPSAHLGGRTWQSSSAPSLSSWQNQEPGSQSIRPRIVPPSAEISVTSSCRKATNLSTAALLRSCSTWLHSLTLSSLVWAGD